MDTSIGQGGFRIGVFILMLSLILMFVVDRGSAEWVLMVTMTVCSSVFLGAVAILVRMLSRE
jgi:diacylglycerol kinase